MIRERIGGFRLLLRLCCGCYGHFMIVNSNEDASDFGDGNDAAAWAAADAGVGFVSHYPGAPINRVADVLAASSADITFNHSLNEHVAALSALGASLCGARSLVVMKHVGLNIAADPLNYAGAVRIKGGMVIVVGTDPGARSSTGEEDVHWYAAQFNFPLLEPVSVQGVYETVGNAYEMSERFHLPVLVFIPGRIAYQSSLICRSMPSFEARTLVFEKDPKTLVNAGASAVRNHRVQIETLNACAGEPARAVMGFNGGATFGIVTRGASYAVVCEVIADLNLGDRVHLLNIERTFPLHLDSFLEFAKGKRAITVVEDQDGFLETMLKRDAFGAVSCSIHGKDIFPAWGEIRYEQVRDYLKSEFECPDDLTLIPLDVPEVPERPGACCEGCPHRPTLYAIEQALSAEDGVIGGDIGCSSLPPYRIDWLLCMNAGIGISQGIAAVLPQQSLVSVGGDGSLFHGGLLSLQSAVENNVNLTHIILDNQSVAMTGHQMSPTTGGKFDMRGLMKAIGVRHIFEVNAFMPSLSVLAIQKARKLEGVKVIRVMGECALQAEAGRSGPRHSGTLRIDATRCDGCTRCYTDLQCPAIERSEETGCVSIDTERCRKCGACLDVCPHNAILITRTAASLVANVLMRARSLRRCLFQILNR